MSLDEIRRRAGEWLAAAPTGQWILELQSIVCSRGADAAEPRGAAERRVLETLKNGRVWVLARTGVSPAGPLLSHLPGAALVNLRMVQAAGARRADISLLVLDRADHPPETIWAVLSTVHLLAGADLNGVTPIETLREFDRSTNRPLWISMGHDPLIATAGLILDSGCVKSVGEG